MTNQEIRAHAVQAAAILTGPGGSFADLVRHADLISGYIARGSGLVPPEDS
jgi:hypothetical protein